MGVSKLDISIVERPAPARGPSSSADYNAFIEETINSVAQIAISWNEEVQPLLDSLPSGDRNVIREDRLDSPNPYVNGFDGSQMYLDLTSTVNTDDGKYYSADLLRPFTIKESIENVQSQLNDAVQSILVRIAQVESDSGITTRQKQAIGSRVFDPETTSNPSSLDGLTQTLERNLDQVAIDIYGAISFLTNSGSASLDYNILDQLNAVQTEHNYNPVTNTLDHSHLPLQVHRYHISPVGPLDGVNKEYEIPGGEKFIIGSVRALVNGLELEKSIDYTERPDRRAINITAAHRALENNGLGADDKIWLHYDIDPNDP
jgi:hypothetical protein